MGSSRYRSEELPDLPAAGRGADALGAVLSQWPAALISPERSTVLQDPDQPTLLGALADAADAAVDTLVFYYAGHGLVSRDGELLLAVHDTDPSRPYTGAPFSTVREILAGSRAAYKVVILDCCFSGRAVEAMSAPTNMVDGLVDVAGTVIMAATGPSNLAFAPLEEAFPTFTGELITLLQDGAPGGPEFIDTDLAFEHVHRALTARQLPSPHHRRSGADSIALARNAAYTGSFTEPPPARRGGSTVPPEEAEQPTGPGLPPARPRWSVPGFSGETSAGPDLLGTAQDAAALSVLIASRSLRPPLALGLFGNWGSGKTFFMRQLERGIGQLTTGPAAEARDRAAPGVEPVFCGRVVSVWFNAWHYAEANVWASLLHHIFQSLCDVKDAPEQLLDQALRQVQGVRETKNAATAAAEAAERTAADAAAEVARTEQEHRQALDRAAEVRARDLWDGLTLADSPALAALDDATRAVGLGDVGSSAQEVADAVDASRRLAGDARALATAGRWYRTPLFLGLLAAAVIAVGGVLVSGWYDWPTHWAATAAATAAPLLAFGSGAAAWITRQTALARQLLAPAVELRAQIDQRLEDLAAEQLVEADAVRERLDTATADLAAARAALALALGQEEAAHAALDDLTGARLLDRYLAERAASAEYGRYLGVVALAHRDLRDLEAFLRRSVAEGGGGIDRIVLYIDDLDRCPPKVVATVLEAVHLLLALPLFVVVVGVDARWLSRSLLDQHPLLLSPAAGPSAAADDEGHARPADYLDKIFQLGYTLPPMSRQNSVDLLTYTARSTQRTGAPAGAGGSAPAAGTAGGAAQERTVAADEAARPGEDRDAARDAVPTAAGTAAAAAALVLGEQEIRLLEVVAPAVGSSPRLAKRFLNLYRVMKARVLTDPDQQPLTATDESCLMILTALTVGFPDAMPAALADAPGEMKVAEWLGTRVRGAVHGPDAARLEDFLGAAEALDELPVAAMTAWLPLVRRYAWPITAQAGPGPRPPADGVGRPPVPTGEDAAILEQEAPGAADQE